MQVIPVTSSKGGVGKSEVAKQLAYQLDRDDYEVAMMDADIDSSNLSSRMGIDERVEHNDDDLIVPIEKDGIKVYSMESAFTDSSFSQSGEFMRLVIRNMVSGAQWDDPDCLIVDTPPGTKDIFDELINVLRDDLLGAVVVGQSESIDDVGRMTKVCNHNYVPIIGYVENMSGVYMNGRLLKDNGTVVAPFGRGNIQALADEVNGRFLGHLPLCHDKNDIQDAAKNCIKGMAIAAQEAQSPELPNLSHGNKGFIRNVWGGLKALIKKVNNELDVSHLQEEFGNPKNPKVVAVHLTDAEDSWGLPNKIHLKIEGGVKVVKSPRNVYGGIKITSQELKFALEGERTVMDSPQALYSDDPYDTTEYGLVEAIQMGKAEVYGEDVINYLSLLDKVFEDVIGKDRLREMDEA